MLFVRAVRFSGFQGRKRFADETRSFPYYSSHELPKDLTSFNTPSELTSYRRKSLDRRTFYICTPLYTTTYRRNLLDRYTYCSTPNFREKLLDRHFCRSPVKHVTGGSDSTEAITVLTRVTDGNNSNRHTHSNTPLTQLDGNLSTRPAHLQYCTLLTQFADGNPSACTPAVFL